MDTVYDRDDFEPAVDYSKLVTRTGDHVVVTRVRLYDGHRYHWCHQLIAHGKLHAPTDQTFDLNANDATDLDRFDEIWLDGVQVYKKPWWKKLFLWLRTKA
ncbi:hypothetical protein [Vibrio barjaei]|uniref:hypothetical protein n=1 Tax=Vibrio barjaei TaxID=1676683 RepID=UPI0022837FAF|nr:hypothetical protein [Vibrio barjaei]MCY9870483.1 hypothetical protein [Vibrio barjaei]